MEPYQTVFRRIEKKYILTDGQYRALCDVLDGRVHPDERYFRSNIANLYYDTPTALLTRRSCEKPVFKEKLRLRCYELPDDTTPAFLEIKRKVRGVVSKRRAVFCYAAALGFLADTVPYTGDDPVLKELACFRDRYPGLAPAVVIAYERASFAGDAGLRLTFDEALRWRTDDPDLRHGTHGAPLLRDGQRLLEIKAPGAMPMWLARALSEYEIFPVSFSKVGRAFSAEHSFSEEVFPYV